MQIKFQKYQGTGNDFIIMDNRTQLYSGLTKKQINFLCNRRFGIGADGVLLLSNTDGYDFEMTYYNADGLEGSMCGNGGRCMAKFAESIGIHKAKYRFKAADGEHEAEIDLNGFVKLKMRDVKVVDVHSNHFILDTGSPHYVKYTNDIMKTDVKTAGHAIRFSKNFEKEGINVNFVEALEEDMIYVRTYERGVEDETLSCGTGVTASAIIAAHNDNGFNRVEVKTPGGNLSVEFEKVDENNFRDIWLDGPANLVFKGELNLLVED
ncbi:MAG: diaminopimelate epimerase [Chitinophagaceae bacterium]|nr:diaminopimelate epimerase [Chitinophagaceae bacterium]